MSRKANWQKNENNYRKNSAFHSSECINTIFYSFWNFIFPIRTSKDESEFVDYSGKQILNFQLSLLLYTIGLALIAIRFYFNH
jgi:uncharacterized Tic20 family protein